PGSWGQNIPPGKSTGTVQSRPSELVSMNCAAAFAQTTLPSSQVKNTPSENASDRESRSVAVLSDLVAIPLNSLIFAT
ncbi:hypothetical protein, partial [Puniceibacterium antarcticum]|uniref:hypothetical protein n=1 Tax=Puniceibacterium antarcticum TaxID=1206336 RepID=UPI001C557B3B